MNLFFKFFLMPTKPVKIEERTLRFIEYLENARKDGKVFATNEALAKLFGKKSKSSISEILKKRSNIQPEQWKKFKEVYGIVEGEGVKEGSNNFVPRETGLEVKYTVALEKLVAEKEDGSKGLKTTVSDLERKVSALIETQDMLLEYIARRVARVDKVPRESVYFELNSLKAELKRAGQNKDIQTDSDKRGNSLRKK